MDIYVISCFEIVTILAWIVYPLFKAKILNNVEKQDRFQREALQMTNRLNMPSWGIQGAWSIQLLNRGDMTIPYKYISSKCE